MASLRRILLATDLEPKSDRAMERAVQLARRFDAELTALHVVDGTGGPYGCLPLHHVEAELQRHILAVPGGAEIRSQAVAVRGEAVEHRVAGYAGLWLPDLIVVGGGVSKKHEQFLPLLDLRTPIVPAALRNAAGIVGAAALAAQTV